MLLPRQGRPFPEQLSRTSYASPQSTEWQRPFRVKQHLPGQLRSDSRGIAVDSATEASWIKLDFIRDIALNNTHFQGGTEWLN